MSQTVPSPGAAGVEEPGSRFPAHGRRRVVLWAVVLWTAGLCLLVAAPVMLGVTARFASAEGVPPWAESARADRLLARGFQAGAPHLVLLARTGEGSVDDPAAADAGRRLARGLARDAAVAQVTSYWIDGLPSLRSDDGRAALILARFRGDTRAMTAALRRLVPGLRGTHGPLRVSVTGEAQVRDEERTRAVRDLRVAGLVVVPLMLIIVLVAAGGLIAAVVPITVGILALLGTMASLRLLTGLAPVPVLVAGIALSLGLALAIGHGLFAVARFRAELAHGRRPGEAARVTTGATGRAMLRSSVVAGVSLSPLLSLPIPLARSIAYGGITAVACAVVAGLLVPPALLVALGHRVRARPPSDREGVTWPAVFRRPLVVTPPIVALSLVLAAPFAHVRFGLPDDRVLPPGAPAAQVARDVRQTFPINATIAATTVVLPGTRPPDPRALDAYARRISLLPGALRVDAVTGTYVGGRRLSSAIAKVGRFAPAPVMPATKGMGWWIRPVSRSGGGVARPGRPPFSAAAGRTTPVPDIGAARFISPSGTWLRVITSGEADSPENGALAREIRAVPAPGRALVGGPGARLADVTGVVRDRLVPGLALVAAVMLALLCAVTRSPLLAVRTLLAHALGLAAALGIVVHIFQDGHLRALVGDFTPTGGIDALMPGVVCCAGSALAMSHQMFLLCRIREERRHVADTPKAVALGVRHTGWPLVATALLSAAIMLSLTASVTLKMAGIGVAVAVLVTAGLIFLQALPPVSRTRPRIAPARPRRPGPGRP